MHPPCRIYVLFNLLYFYPTATTLSRQAAHSRFSLLSTLLQFRDLRLIGLHETNLRFFSSRGQNGIHFVRLLFSLLSTLLQFRDLRLIGRRVLLLF